MVGKGVPIRVVQDYQAEKRDRKQDWHARGEQERDPDQNKDLCVLVRYLEIVAAVELLITLECLETSDFWNQQGSATSLVPASKHCLE